MRHILGIGIIIVGVLICTGIGSADQANATETMYPWNGTWSSGNFTIYIAQNETGIAGAYVPADLEELDPGMLEGNLSDDGSVYSGVWIETGSSTYTLSEDMQSFTISGYADPQGPMTEPTPYTGNATRIGEITDPANPWTGSFTSTWKMYNLTQDGSSLTGLGEPLLGVNDETGVLNGTVSADGTILTARWVEKGRYTFELADDGSSLNATIAKSLKPDAIVQHITFSR